MDTLGTHATGTSQGDEGQGDSERSGPQHADGGVELTLGQAYEAHCAAAITALQRIADGSVPLTDPAQFEALMVEARRDLDACENIVWFAYEATGQRIEPEPEAPETEGSRAADDTATAHEPQGEGPTEGAATAPYIADVHQALIASEQAAYQTRRQTLAAAYEHHRLKGVGAMEMLAAIAQTSAAILKWDADNVSSPQALATFLGEADTLLALARTAIEARRQLAEFDAWAEAIRAAQPSPSL